MFKKVSIASLSVILLSICCAFAVKRPTRATQEKPRVVTESTAIRFPGYIAAPVRIDKIAVGDQVVSFAKDFTAPDGFLKSLRVQVVNESDKAVTFFSLNLKMQSGKDEKNILVPCEFGDTSWKKGAPSVEPPALLQPGQSLWVNLLEGRKSGRDPMESLKEVYEPKGHQFELGVDIVMMERDSMWRIGYFHIRTEPTRFVPIKNGQAFLELPRGIKMEKALHKPGTSGAPAPCPYNWNGSYNYVSCNDMYGAICVYQSHATTPNGWYNYAGSSVTTCFMIWGGGDCFPSDYYDLAYAYCGI